ncbi:MAG TPA: hydroxyacid dehydrogenase [Candidatus Limnocylindrales bacterium]
MTGTPLPYVWFERPVLPSLEAAVRTACSVLGPGTADDRYAGIETAIGAVVAASPFDGSVMDRAPGLRVIARTGIGYDTVDVAAATARGIAVCNTPDGPTISTAEHALTLMLMVAKRMKAAESAMATGRTSGYYSRHEGMELAGKVLGLIGCGRIARRVGAMAAGIGMRVVAFDPYLDAMPDGIDRAEALDDVLAIADVVSVHVPLSDASRGMFDATKFAAMKPGAVFINTARGGLVDQDALLAALDEGHLAGAGLDVTEPEPLPMDHPLLGRDDVVVTPHVASATADGKVRILEAAIDQALTVIRGERPAHLVNPTVWDRVAAATASGGHR